MRIAVKTLGGRYDLKIHAIGTVTDNSKKEDGILSIRWDRTENLYSGKGPSGKGSGEWFGTLTQITNPNAIKLIFGEESIPFTPDSFSKNVILYGPPGTGKTYNTTKISVDIMRT